MHLCKCSFERVEMLSIGRDQLSRLVLRSRSSLLLKMRICVPMHISLGCYIIALNAMRKLAFVCEVLRIIYPLGISLLLFRPYSHEEKITDKIGKGRIKIQHHHFPIIPNDAKHIERRIKVPQVNTLTIRCSSSLSRNGMRM